MICPRSHSCAEAESNTKTCSPTPAASANSTKTFSLMLSHPVLAFGPLGPSQQACLLPAQRPHSRRRGSCFPPGAPTVSSPDLCAPGLGWGWGRTWALEMVTVETCSRGTSPVSPGSLCCHPSRSIPGCPWTPSPRKELLPATQLTRGRPCYGSETLMQSPADRGSSGRGPGTHSLAHLPSLSSGKLAPSLPLSQASILHPGACPSVSPARGRGPSCRAGTRWSYSPLCSRYPAQKGHSRCSVAVC